MKKNKAGKAVAALVSLALAVGITTAFAMAETPPVPQPNPGGYTVSDKLDTAENVDPSMGTQYWMYLEPDPEPVNQRSNLPKMGDEGVDLNTLLLATLGVGAAYLGSRAYEKRCDARDKA